MNLHICILAVWNLPLLHLSLWGSCGHVLWSWVLQILLGRVRIRLFVGADAPPAHQLYICSFLHQVPQREDSGGCRSQYFLPGLWVLPAGSGACDRECCFQRDGPAISTVWHQGRNKRCQIMSFYVCALTWTRLLSFSRHLLGCRHSWRTTQPSAGVPCLDASGLSASLGQVLATVTLTVSPCCLPQPWTVAKVTFSAGKLENIKSMKVKTRIFLFTPYAS